MFPHCMIKALVRQKNFCSQLFPFSNVIFQPNSSFHVTSRFPSRLLPSTSPLPTTIIHNHHSFPSPGYNGLKNRAIAAEADKVALKGEIACIGEEVGRLDKAATRLLREKHEMWQSISVSYCRSTDSIAFIALNTFFQFLIFFLISNHFFCLQ